MTLAMRLLVRVVQRRLSGGERLTDILAHYPKLSEDEREQVRSAECAKQEN